MLASSPAKSITVVAAFVAVASVATLFTLATPQATAEPKVVRALQQSVAAEATVIQPNKGQACSSRSWPHYDQSCLFDRRNPAREAGAVRVIAIR